MRNLSPHSIHNLTHHSLVQLDTINTLVLTEVEVLSLAIELPVFQIHDRILHRLMLSLTFLHFNLVDLMDFVVLFGLLRSSLTPLTRDQEIGRG